MKTKLTRNRLDGLYLLALGGVVFVLLGIALENISPAPMSDFKAIYYGARCVIHNSDPYQNGEIQKEFTANGEQVPADPVISRSVQRAIFVCINLPTTLFLVAPFALLAFVPSHVIWMTLMAGSLLVAAYLAWDFGSPFSPVVAGALVGTILANSEVLIIIGNTAAIVISLAIIAVWTFVKDRFALLGVLCIAISLALKPHDAGFIWLYFLLAGRVQRKRALQSLLVAIVISIPAVLWVSHVSPDWMHEIHENLAATSAHGDLNDPGPSSIGAHTLGMVVSLQTLVSTFRDEPGFYNLVTYLVIGPLILLWVLNTIRTQFSKERMWLALAAISALSLLPVYHRIYDAKLLLLSVPACAMLWSKGGAIRWLAVGISTLAILCTSDLPWVVFSVTLSHFRPMMPWLTDSVLNFIVAFPAPVALLAMGVFYLWVYVRSGSLNALEIKANS